MSAEKKPTSKAQSSPKGNFGFDPSGSVDQIPIRIIAVSTLRKFWKDHTDAEQPLKSWYQEATDTRWSEPNDIKLRYPSVDILPDNRVVFNIKGNKYRLIVKIHYNTDIVFIRFVGTRVEYDRITPATI